MLIGRGADMALVTSPMKTMSERVSCGCNVSYGKVDAILSEG